MSLRLLYILFTFAGMSALIYEVIWTRAFRLVFGSSTRSAGAVLAAFFLGMALGNLLGARLARRSDVVRLYGWTELVIGLTALLVGPWLALYETWYPHVYALAGDNVAALSAIRLLLAFLALAPPTIAMGVTLPLMSRAIVTDPDRVARQTGLLYALNILGAVVGVFLAGFVLPMRLGIAGSVYLAVGINVVVGLTALAASRRISAPPAADAWQPVDAISERPASRPSLSLVIAAAVSGFGTLALEVAYMRILSQRTESSVYSFAIMLITFLLFLAVGSAWVAWRLDRTDPWRFLAKTQLVAVPMILVSPLAFQAVQVVGFFGGDESLTVRLIKLTLSTWLLLGPTIALVGVVLPTTWKIATRDVASVGQHVGLLTSVNTLAAVAGSLAAGFIFLPRLGVLGSVLVVAPLYGLVAIMALFKGYEGSRRWLGSAACLAMLIAWPAVVRPWDLNFQYVRPGDTLLSYRDGEAASVAVIETRAGHRVMKMNHEYVLGSSGGADRELTQGRLPLVLHPRPKKVAFIGVATGITAAAAMEFPVEKVVAMEIIPGVVDEVDQFEKWNYAFYRDPRTTMVVDDGRNHLLGTDEKFDVIVGDLFVPWHAGTGDMYTVEHFKNCRDRLAPGGLFAQCLAGYQLTVEELRSIVASFAEAFPAVSLWRNDFDLRMPILCLVGYRDPADVVIDPEKIRQDCARFAAKDQAPAGILEDPSGVELMFLCGDEALRRWADGAPKNTDNWPYIEYSTPASYFRHRQMQIEPILELMSGKDFRPPVWPYAEAVSSDPSLARSFQAADLIHKAALAESKKNYPKERGYLTELIATAGELPAVEDFIIQSAARYRQRKMTERSNELLEAVLARSPDSIQVLLFLAQSMRSDGNDEEAIRLLERVIALDPERAEVRRRLVTMLISNNHFEQAEPHLTWLVEAEPDDAGLRIDLARSYHQQGKSTNAAEQIEIFRKLDLGENREQLWSRLRTFGLGGYVDRPETPTQSLPSGNSKSADSDAGPYRVPSGGVQELLSFIAHQHAIRKTTPPDEYESNAYPAMKAAVEKILKLADAEDRKRSEFNEVIAMSLYFRVTESGDNPKVEVQEPLTAEARNNLVRDIKAYFIATKEPSHYAIVAADKLPLYSVESGRTKLALEIYQELGPVLAGSKNTKAALLGQQMLGAARRLELVGKPIEIRGTTHEGNEFDLSEYRGRVVLIDFWSTTCAPCLTELPKMKEIYEVFHDRGFEIVGISLDDQRKELDRFLAAQSLPWKTLYDGPKGKNSVALRYGIMSLPTCILVDRSGNVVSLQARGKELSEQLERLIGSSSLD